MKRQKQRGILLPAGVISLNLAVILSILFWPSRIQTPIAIEPRFEAGWRLPSKPVKIATYNIGTGKRLDEAIELLRNEDPDIVCMQEILSGQVKRVELGLKMSGCWFTSSNHSDEGVVGKALFTRGRLSQAQSMPNAHGGSFGVWAAVEIHGGRFLVGSVHLMDLKSTRAGYPARELEIRALHDALEKVGGPALFAGDFNNPPKSVNYKLMTKKLTDLGVESGPTHPSNLPFLRIDYVFGTGEWETVSAKCIKTTISDHIPLIVVVQASDKYQESGTAAKLLDKPRDSKPK